MRRFVDLNHVVRDGMVTYPGLPTPTVEVHLSRDRAEQVYGQDVTFEIGVVTLCTNTGTYLDTPYHRFADGHDLAGLALERVVDVPAICLDRRGRRAIEVTSDDLFGADGHAVLVRTGHDRHFGTDAYAADAPFLTSASVDALVAAGVAVVGIDSLNIDDVDDLARPVHTGLLAAGIPIVEHLTGLGQLPPSGFTFTAVPPKIAGAGTFTVRAFATLADLAASD
ncbi:cyclase family protein [Salsipaludibacter albus]|uniref:cyclase family protein n=1 Tax=Salsipaludibacter albus TaxID=2849650 RepID=UPI001EE4924A|nr:cyclase family protein [Salsipaludibacter albus]MBY5164100.1 cyclase family protein [Salsipaludibacter albus]